MSGHCIALVQGDDRTLAANIGAAAKYREEDLQTESAKTILFSVKILYVEGFFLSHSPGVVRALCDICQENSVSLAFNLCGEYVCRNQGQFTKPAIRLQIINISRFVILFILNTIKYYVLVNLFTGLCQKCSGNISLNKVHIWKQK